MNLIGQLGEHVGLVADQLLRRLQGSIQLSLVHEFYDFFPDLARARRGGQVIVEKPTECFQVLVFVPRKHVGALQGKINPCRGRVCLALGKNLFVPNDGLIIVNKKFGVAAHVFQNGTVYDELLTGFNIKL